MLSNVKNNLHNPPKTQPLSAQQKQFYEQRISLLEEKIRYLNQQLYGRKTEKLTLPDGIIQDLLFGDLEETESVESSPEDSTIVPEHTRKKRGRRPFPENLPCEENILDIAEDEKVCGCGTQMSEIGREESKQLKYTKPEIKVIKNIRLKYACKNCEGVENPAGAVKIAPVPPTILPKSFATASLISHIIISKFCDALPLYRQSKMFLRMDIELSRELMSQWIIKVHLRLELFMTLMEKEARCGPVLNIDETPVQVLSENGRANTTKSYIWVLRGGQVNAPVLLFKYHPTRSGEFARQMVADYQGYVQTDGYQGYDFMNYSQNVSHLNCWAHSRRKFMDVVKAAKQGKGKVKMGKAGKALSYINALYSIEKECRQKELSPNEIYQVRQEKSVPLLKELKLFLEEVSLKTNPEGLLGKAVSYTVKRWAQLEKYIESGYLRMDNNLAENAIRPLVVGRKNWLFCGSPEGAHASATMYSIIETAKANGHEPYEYLNYLFEKLPYANSEDDVKALLPQLVDKEKIKARNFS